MYGIHGYSCVKLSSTASSDYEYTPSITTREAGSLTIQIRLLAVDDDLTLEYDDRVILTFNPADSGLPEHVELAGEFIRHTATVTIIDNDSKVYIVLKV